MGSVDVYYRTICCRPQDAVQRGDIDLWLTRNFGSSGRQLNDVHVY